MNSLFFGKKYSIFGRALKTAFQKIIHYYSNLGLVTLTLFFLMLNGLIMEIESP